MENCKLCENELKCIECLDGYYAYEDKCLKCNSKCLTCSLSTCLSCDTSLRQDNPNSNCPCKDGYYEENDECKTCSRYCLKCTSFEVCILCESFRVGDLCECALGFYEVGESECEKCQVNCNKCLNDKQCIECVQDMALDDNGNCQCSSGYFLEKSNDDPSYSHCAKCIQPCVECISQNQCKECTQENGFAGTINKQLECLCSEGYYYSLLYCIECSNKCKSCIDNEYCIQCYDENRDIYNKCECIDGYLSIVGQKNCEKCAFPCLTCLGQIDICTKCPEKRQGEKCQCQSQYFSLDQVYQCQKCSSKCNGCEERKDKCLSCFEEQKRVLDDQGNCICEEGYYQEYNKDVCSMCFIACSECIDSYQCSLCKNPDLMILDRYCECIDGYYQDRDQCYQCFYKCRTCHTYTQCKECYPNRSIDLNCDCSIGYFEDKNKQCLKCSSSCKECQQTKDQCTSCNDPLQIIKNGRCVCIDQFYYQDNQCHKCDYKCKTCKSKYECIKCESELRSLESGCKCLPNYYEKNQTCSKCSVRCKTCIIYDDICLTCSSEHRSISSNCQCEKYYADIGDVQCMKCSPPCLECVGLPTYCLSCIENRILKYDKCICEQGYYEYGLYCNKCLQECQECSDESTCTQCRQFQQLYEGRCYCIDGYYKQDNECQKCLQACKICSSLDNCSQCKDELLMLPPLCLCGDGFFYERESSRCRNCDSKRCETCEGSAIDCTSCARNRETPPSCECISGFIQISDECQPCSKSCRQCIEKVDNCISCTENRGDIPKCTCLEGYYEDVEQVCQKCNYRCQQCFEHDTCLICQKNRDMLPFCSCKEGFYEENKECYSCSPRCSSCSKKEECIGCSANREYPPYCSCLLGYYEDKNVCYQCSSGCRKCDSYEQCQQCTSENFFYKQKCYKECPQSTFKHYEECLDCSKECLHCKSETSCQECKVQYVRLDEYCLQDCPRIGYYNQDKVCQKCHQTCRTCKGSSVRECMSCTEDKRLMQGKCLADCDESLADCTICKVNDDLYCFQFLQLHFEIDINEERIYQVIIKIRASTNFENSNSTMIQKDNHQWIQFNIPYILYDYEKIFKQEGNHHYIILYINLNQSLPNSVAQLHFQDPSMIKDNFNITLNPEIYTYQLHLRQCLIPNDNSTELYRDFKSIQDSYLSTAFFGIVKDICTNIQMISFVLNAAQPIAQLLLINATMPVNAYRIISLFASPVIFSIPQWEQENTYQNFSMLHSLFFKLDESLFQKVPFRFRRIQLTGCFIIDAILPVLILSFLLVVFAVASVTKHFLYVPKLRIGDLRGKLLNNPEYLKGDIEKEREHLAYQRYIKYYKMYNSYYKPPNRDLLDESYGLVHFTLNLIFLIFEGNLWLLLGSSFLQLRIFEKDNLYHWVSLPFILFIYAYLLVIILKSSVQIMSYTHSMIQRISPRIKFKPSRSILQLIFPFNYIEPRFQRDLIWIQQIHSFSFSQISLARPIFFLFHQISFFKKFAFILILVFQENGEQQLLSLLLLNGLYFFLFYASMKPFQMMAQNFIHILAELTFLLILYAQLQSHRMYQQIKENQELDQKLLEDFFTLGQVMYVSSFTYLILYLFSMVIQPFQTAMILLFIHMPIFITRKIRNSIKQSHTVQEGNQKIHTLYHSLVVDYLLQTLDFQDFMMLVNNKPFEKVFNRKLMRSYNKIKIVGKYRCQLDIPNLLKCLQFDYFRSNQHPNAILEGCQIDSSDSYGNYYWIKYSQLLKSRQLNVIKKILCEAQTYDLIRQSSLCSRLTFYQIDYQLKNAFRLDDYRYWCLVDYFKRKICVKIRFQKDLADIQLEMQSQEDSLESLVASLDEISKHGRTLGLILCLLNETDIQTIPNSYVRDVLGDEWVVMKYDPS